MIGLGLLGQLTCLMLRASGVKSFGIDVDQAVVDMAKEHCCEAAWARGDAGIMEEISRRTEGIGTDTVIITAATASLDPINFAGSIARRKGRVIVVGAVPTGFDREPDYYKKELELRMSCSYGPGRYDLDYEEKGHDYPAAYVRWTENRNMQAFQDLIQRGRISLNYLTTHEFTLDQAPQAYNMIVERAEPFLGIVIKYDIEKPVERSTVAICESRPAGHVGIAFIGAGSYAQGHLLPNIPRHDAGIVCRAVMTNSGTTSKRVAERFGFEHCTSRLDDILRSDDINTVFVATRHDTHATYVKQALQAGKHVFVEKPICLTEQELAEIVDLHRACASSQLMVGFNVRFAPLAESLKTRLGQSPMAMIYRVNAGAVPADTWIQDPDVGGGRIVGEACHFIDFLTFLSGAADVGSRCCRTRSAAAP